MKDEKIENTGSQELRNDLIKICKNLELFRNEPLSVDGSIKKDGEYYKYRFEFEMI